MPTLTLPLPTYGPTTRTLGVGADLLPGPRVRSPLSALRLQLYYLPLANRRCSPCSTLSLYQKVSAN